MSDFSENLKKRALFCQVIVSVMSRLFSYRGKIGQNLNESTFLGRLFALFYLVESETALQEKSHPFVL